MSYTYEAFEQTDARQSLEGVLFMKPSIAITYEKIDPRIPDLIKGHHDDVGYDISIIAIKEALSSRTALYETGITLFIPRGYFVILVPRSSIARRGYFMTNSIGIIDPGYRGTIAVSLTKISDEVPDLKFPSRVAQLIVTPVTPSAFFSTVEIPCDTSRGTGGFGSTGLND